MITENGLINPIEYGLNGVRLDRQKIAYEMFYIPPIDRLKLGYSLGLENYRGLVLTAEIENIMHKSYELTAKKVEGIGLTVPEYVGAYEALRDLDMDALGILTAKSKERILEKRQEYRKTTRQANLRLDGTRYKDERLYFHHKIVKDKIQNIKPEKNPKLLIIAGAPGSGKTFLRTNFIEKYPNYVVTDPDSLRKNILPEYNPEDAKDVFLTQEESFDVATLLLDESLRKNLNIVCETSLRNIDWLIDVLPNTKNYSLNMILNHTPFHECLKRSVAWRSRAASLDFILSAVSGYENYFNLAKLGIIENMKIVKSKNNPKGKIEVISEMHKGSTVVENTNEVNNLQQYVNKFNTALLF